MATEEQRKQLEDLLQRYDQALESPDDFRDKLLKMIGAPGQAQAAGNAPQPGATPDPQDQDFQKAVQAEAKRQARREAVNTRIKGFVETRVEDGKQALFNAVLTQKLSVMRQQEPDKVDEAWKFDIALDALLESVAKENQLLKAEGEPAKDGDKDAKAGDKDTKDAKTAPDGQRSLEAVKEGDGDLKGDNMDDDKQTLTKPQEDVLAVLEKNERMLDDDEFETLLSIQTDWDKQNKNPQPIVVDGQYLTSDYFR